MKGVDHRSAGGQAAAASRRRAVHRLSITGKLAAIVIAFSLAMAGLLLVLECSLSLAGGMRAYVDGEGLWSKGQKDGSYWLARYLRTRDETDFDHYRKSIAWPLGDYQARLEMDRPQFDPALATADFLAGGNAAADIPVMIYLYRQFGRTALFAPAIAIWADADRDLLELDHLAGEIHSEVIAGNPSLQRQSELLARLDDVNLRLTGKEMAFSTTLGVSNRRSQQLLVSGAVVAAALLLLCGFAVSWGVARNIRGSIARLRRAALRVAAGDLSRPIEVRGSDELADLAEVFNRMVRHRREAEEFSDLVMQNATNSISVLDQQGRFTMANRRAREITGRGDAQLIGQPFAAMLAQEQREEMSRRFQAVLHHGESIRNQEMDVVRPDGSRVTISFSSSPLYKDGQVFAQVCTAEDITERKRADAFIRHSAQHDALTNLPNRTLLLDRLEMAMRQARHRDDEVAVLMIDLDNFKRINDSLGHPVGDRLLLCVAQRLRDSVREVDTVARLGGDEFIIVISDTAGGAGELEEAIARITAAISTPIMIDQDELLVTPSIGGCVYPRDGIDTRTLLKHADIAMYHAKAAGRSNMQWFCESMLNESREKLALGAALRRALENEELRVYYQPKVCLKSGRCIGMEALVRWHHPEHGEVDPNRFVPLAEETGQIRRLGEWVLKTACREYPSLRRDEAQALHLAVNVSPRQFESPGFIEVVHRTLRDTGLEPRRLELEITESMLMRNPEEAVDMLRRLRQLGVAVVIDDFGTGYSSLSYLTRFPIDKIKIDRTFVRDLSTDAADAAVINAIIAMAHSLGIRVVAEGVETEAQQIYLRERGCDEAQGFFYSRAVTAEQFQSLAA